MHAVAECLNSSLRCWPLLLFGRARLPWRSPRNARYGPTSSPAIPLSDKGPLWIGRTRGLLTGLGYAIALISLLPARTNFGAGLVRSQPMTVYEDTSVGEVRHAMASGEFKVTGDANKMVDAMITAADSSAPPLRLTLGSIAYASIHKGLNDRLVALEASKRITLSTDLDR